MIEVRDFSNRKIYLAPDAIASVKEAGPSSLWHGIRSYITCFDGMKIDSSDTAESVVAQIEKEALT